jgi:hypothetical protein
LHSREVSAPRVERDSQGCRMPGYAHAVVVHPGAEAAMAAIVRNAAAPGGMAPSIAKNATAFFAPSAPVTAAWSYTAALLSPTQTPHAAALDAATDAAASSATSRIDCTRRSGSGSARDIVVLGGEPRKEERLGRCYR